jgi:membrane protease YdiL (CAAX protease family)
MTDLWQVTDLWQPQALIWLLLMPAMLLQWLPSGTWPTRLQQLPLTRHQLSWLLLVSALLSAVVLGALSIFTGVGLLLFLGLLRWCQQRQGYWQYALHASTIIACLALSLHLIPGFDNWLVLSQVQAGPESTFWSMYLNLDKPLALFILLWILPQLGQLQPRWTLTGWRPATAVVSPVEWLRWSCAILLAIALLSALALAAGFIRWEPKLPSWWWLFLLNNLLLTCLVEEAFFRGYLQQQLQQKLGAWPALVLASALFGLAHLGGGWLYAMLATLAGLLYGLIYLHTGRLWLAVLTHASLNFVHLCFFTYPWPLVR